MMRKRLSLLSVVALLCLFEVGTINSSDKGTKPKTYTITLERLKKAFKPDICGSYEDDSLKPLLSKLEENLDMSHEDFRWHMLTKQKLYEQINGNLKPEFQGATEDLLKNHMLIKEDDKITFHNPIDLSKD